MGRDAATDTDLCLDSSNESDERVGSAMVTFTSSPPSAGKI